MVGEEAKLTKRLEGKTAVVIGAGQTPGDTIGNGRAISILFAQIETPIPRANMRLEDIDEL